MTPSRSSWLTAIIAVYFIVVCHMAFGQTFTLFNDEADYLRLCSGDAAKSEKCQRFGSIIAQRRAEQWANTRDFEMISRGCVALTDQVLASNPPQYEWLCPEIKP